MYFTNVSIPRITWITIFVVPGDQVSFLQCGDAAHKAAQRVYAYKMATEAGDAMRLPR